jgi:hypothetical protein
MLSLQRNDIVLNSVNPIILTFDTDKDVLLKTAFYLIP